MIPLADFQHFFINNRGFAERYFSDKVNAILIEDQRSRTNYVAWRRQFTCNTTKMFTSAFKFLAKYSHIKL